MFLSERRRIAELELSVKLPTMSYGVDLRGQFRRAVTYVDSEGSKAL